MASKAPRAVRDSEPLDLWLLAREIDESPLGDSNRRRVARRLQPKRRVRNWIMLAFGVLVILIGGAVTFAESVAGAIGVLASVVSSLLLFAGIWIGSSAAMNLLNARLYRRVSEIINASIGPTWWVVVVAAYATLVLGISGTIAVISAEYAGAEVIELQEATVTAMLVGFSLSLVAPLLTSPLLTAAKRPKLFHSQAVVLLWTVAMIGVLISLLTLIVQPGDDIEYISLVMTGAFTALGAIVVWHRQRLSALNAVRMQALERILDVMRHVKTGHENPEFIDALRRLQVVCEPGPFRSRSIATPPLAAGWGIRVVVLLLLWASDEGQFPDAITLRMRHPERYGAIFAHPQLENMAAVNAGAETFLRAAHGRLLAQSAY